MISDKTRPVALHIITDLDDGGAEAMLFNLVRGAAGFEHKVISLMGPGKFGPKLTALGVEVSCVDMSRKAPSPLKLLRLRRLVAAANADIVQTWMYHADLLGGLAARSLGLRTVIWGLHHTTVDKEGTRWATRQIVKLNARLSSRLPARIITCSKKGDEVHKAIGYDPDKMIVVHNGYDTSNFKPDSEQRAKIRAEFGIGEDQPLLGCVARYNPQKDHRNLLLGFARVLKSRPDAHLLLIGPGLTPDNAEITAILAAQKIQPNVTLVGARPDIPAVMNGLDLHVLGSAFGEAFPNVLSEAMACGTPCVATDVGDSRTIIGDTGLICPPRDPDALASAVLRMLPDMNAAEIQEKCRSRIVNNFTRDHMVAGYTAVWRKCIGEVDGLFARADMLGSDGLAN